MRTRRRSTISIVILLALGLLASAVPGSGPAAANAGSTTVQLIEEDPLPEWLVAGKTASVFAGLSEEGVAASEFGHEHDLGLHNPQRFAVGSPYHQISDRLSSFQQDATHVVVDDTNGDGRDSAIVAHGGRVSFFGPAEDGFPHLDTRTPVNPGVSVKGLAVLFLPGASFRPVLVATGSGFFLYQVDGNYNVFPEGIIPSGDLQDVLGFHPNNLLDLYQRPPWDHLPHERPLPANVFAVTGVRADSNDLVTSLVEWKGGTSLERLGGYSIEDAAAVEATVRYDTPQIPAGGDPNRPGRFELFTAYHRSDRSTTWVAGESLQTPFPQLPKIEGERWCEGGQPGRNHSRPALSVDTYDRWPTVSNPFLVYDLAVACATIRTGPGSVPGDLVDAVVRRTKREGSAVEGRWFRSRDRLVELFDPEQHLATDQGQLSQLDVSLTWPCAGWLEPQPRGLFDSVECPGEYVERLPGSDFRRLATPEVVSLEVFTSATQQGADHGHLVRANRSFRWDKGTTLKPGVPSPSDIPSSPTELQGKSRTFLDEAPPMGRQDKVVAVPLRPKPFLMEVEILNPHQPGHVTQPGIPLVLLTAPPTVSGLDQEVGEPTFSDTKGQSQTDTKTLEASMAFGLGFEIDLNVYRSSASVELGVALAENDSLTNSFEFSDWYSGLPDDHSVVVRENRLLRYEGRVLSTSNGASMGRPQAGDTYHIDVPDGAIRNVRSFSELERNHELLWSVWGEALRNATPATVGNPRTYMEFEPVPGGEGGAQLREYCIGNETAVAGDITFQPPPGQELNFAPNTGGLAPNPFVLNPTMPDGPSILVSNPHSVTLGSSNVSGATISVTESQAKTRSTTMSMTVSVEQKIFAAVLTGERSTSWGREHTLELSQGVEFAAGVGNIDADPNGPLGNEGYEWRQFMCQTFLETNSGGRVPVWAVNFTVDRYSAAASGGLEAAEPAKLSKPIASEVASRTPDFEINQESGTIHKYSLLIEAVGKDDRREIHDLLSINRPIDAKNRPAQQTMAWSALGQDSQLLPDQLYSWRVIGHDYLGKEVSSSVAHFVTEPFPAPDLVAPINSQTASVQPSFVFDHKEPDTQEYTLEIQAIGRENHWSFGPMAPPQGNPKVVRWEDLQGPGSALLPNQLYSWQVTAIDSQNNAATSAVGLFVTDGPSPPELVAPIDSRLTTTTPDFQLRQPATSTLPLDQYESYRLHLEAVGGEHTLSFGPMTIPEGEVKLIPWSNLLGPENTLMPNQLYSWRVVAADRWGNTATSAVEFFVTDGPPQDLELKVSKPAVDVDEPITFTVSHKPTLEPTTYTFDLGDGRPEETLIFIPEGPGTARVVLDLEGIVYQWPGVFPVHVTASNVYGERVASTTVAAGPTANDIDYVVTQHETLDVPAEEGVMSNDEHGDLVRPTPVIAPDHGELTLRQDGSFTYTPDDEFCSVPLESWSPALGDGEQEFTPDRFVYALQGGGVTRQATATIRVECVNHEPIATDDHYDAVEGEVLEVGAPGVLANDDDSDLRYGDAIYAEFASGATNGSVKSSKDGGFTYTPDEYFCGQDSFEYRAVDLEGASSDSATVTIEVECVPDAPQAADHQFDVLGGQPTTFDPPVLLEGLFDPDQGTEWESEGFVVSLSSDAHSGTAQVSEGGGFTYRPEPGFIGQDSFTYEVEAQKKDGVALSGLGTVTLQVKGPTTIATPRAQVSSAGLLSRDVRFRATLTTADTAEPLAGERIRFVMSGSQRCSALTNEDGVATCTWRGANALTTNFKDHTAFFDGTDDYAASSARSGSSGSSPGWIGEDGSTSEPQDPGTDKPGGGSGGGGSSEGGLIGRLLGVFR